MERRNQSLDVLRGIAVLLVIGHHYVPPDQESILHVGGMGVDLFFVLSGYLICNLLLSEIRVNGHVKTGRFLIRRGLKIYPAFYMFLILSIPLVDPQNRAKLLPEFLFLQQYLPHVWQHTWSLSVEETFYITIPILVALLHRWNRLSLFPVVPISILGVLMPARLLGFDPIRLEGLALGSLIAYGKWRYPASLQRYANSWIVPFGAILLLLPAFLLRHTHVVLVCNTLAFACAVSFAAFHDTNRLGFLAAVGRYSYSIYLWHMPVAMFSWIAWPLSAIGFCVNGAFAVLIGIGMARVVEIPVLAFRERFWPSLRNEGNLAMRANIGARVIKHACELAILSQSPLKGQSERPDSR